MTVILSHNTFINVYGKCNTQCPHISSQSVPIQHFMQTRFILLCCDTFMATCADYVEGAGACYESPAYILLHIEINGNVHCEYLLKAV